MPGGPELSAKDVGQSPNPSQAATQAGEEAAAALAGPSKVNTNLAPVLGVYRQAVTSWTTTRDLLAIPRRLSVSAPLRSSSRNRRRESSPRPSTSQVSAPPGQTRTQVSGP